MFKNLWQRRNNHSLQTEELAKKATKSKTKVPARAKNRLKGTSIDFSNERFFYGQDSDRARIELYRFLRDNIPLLSAAIWTWVRLCAGRHDYQILGEVTPDVEADVACVIRDLNLRIHWNGLMKQGGSSELMLQFFESLFTDGAICGELQLSPSKRRVERFQFADMAQIAVESTGDAVRLYQVRDDGRTLLNNESLFYYGLGAQPGTVIGRSLLGSIPFVARVEQTLVSDMHRSMRSTGYNRIHVKISPPEKRLDESDDDYISRSNAYFDDTVEMMRDFGPDKNPVTWDDVAIEYLGSASKTSSSTAWYMNHKSMIEDICAGTHLAPFMLGYAYGTTHNWAEFKYELVLRQVETVQNAAGSLLNWIANVELALAGIDAEVSFKFDNRINLGVKERAEAEQIVIENVITKMKHDLITREEAMRELQRV